MRWLVVTDLDNTLVGDSAALGLLNDQLMAARQRQDLLLVYSTGRSLSSYRQLCATTSLLTPDVLVTAVGTEIYDTAGFEHPNLQWSSQLQHHWDQALVQYIAAPFKALTPQTDAEQRPFKVSYFLEADIAPQVMNELSEALQTQGLLAQLIYSGGKDLDILPQGANKGKAMQFIQTQVDIQDAQTIACGDSGNDIALFGENLGVVVGNAQPELLNWYGQNLVPHRYLAKAHYAAGILEGLLYFGVLPPQTY